LANIEVEMSRASKATNIPEDILGKATQAAFERMVELGRPVDDIGELIDAVASDLITRIGGKKAEKPKAPEPIKAAGTQAHPPAPVVSVSDRKTMKDRVLKYMDSNWKD
jgi:hypothetical protein